MVQRTCQLRNLQMSLEVFLSNVKGQPFETKCLLWKPPPWDAPQSLSEVLWLHLPMAWDGIPMDGKLGLYKELAASPSTLVLN